MFKYLSFLYPSPLLENEQEQIKSEYKYWRIRILYSMFIGYAFYYFTRRSYTYAMPGLMEDLGFDKIELGILGSVMAITYALSKFASGVLVDRINPRYIMALGLMLTGVFNICFGLSSTLLCLAIFWGLNGFFQGFGAPSCAVFLTRWYPRSERGSWWSTWSVSHNVGGFLISWLAWIVLQYFGWRYAMYTPGILCIMMSFFLINRLRDNPDSVGLPPLEQVSENQANIQKSESSQSSKKTFVEYILKNPYIWLLAISYFFVYVVREGVNQWTILFLVETKGYSTIAASGSLSMIEVGGFFGSLTAGYSSDYFFKGRRGPVNVLYAILMILTIGFFWFLPVGYTIIDSIAIFCIGFSIFGPQMMIGLAAAELTHKKAVGSSSGFLGFFAYLGAAFAGFPLGYITQNFGWLGCSCFLLGCCVISTLLLAPLWGVTALSKRSHQESQDLNEGLKVAG